MLKLNCARAENEISKKLFPWVASCGHVGKNVQAKEVNLNGNDSISVAGESYLPYLDMCLHCLQFVRANHNIHKSVSKEMSFSSCI